MIDSYYETENREEQWKACRTAINKSIRNNELKGVGLNELTHAKATNNMEDMITISANPNNNLRIISINESVPISSHVQTSLVTLEPNMSIFQMTNDLDLVLNKIQTNPVCQTNLSLINSKPRITNIVTLTETSDSLIQDENNAYVYKEGLKIFFLLKKFDFLIIKIKTKDQFQPSLNEHNLDILSETEILQLKNLYCSPMIFATKVLLKLFSKEELLGHNVSGKTFHKHLRTKDPLDENRINYIKWLVENYFAHSNKTESIWKSCRKAINRVIRNFEIKESKLIKSLDEGMEQNDSKESD